MRTLPSRSAHLLRGDRLLGLWQGRRRRGERRGWVVVVVDVRRRRRGPGRPVALGREDPRLRRDHREHELSRPHLPPQREHGSDHVEGRDLARPPHGREPDPRTEQLAPRLQVDRRGQDLPPDGRDRRPDEPRIEPVAPPGPRHPRSALLHGGGQALHQDADAPPGGQHARLRRRHRRADGQLQRRHDLDRPHPPSGPRRGASGASRSMAGSTTRPRTWTATRA